MATINTKTTKNIVELRKEYAANGTAMENVYIDGQKFCCIGYVSETDKATCLKAIQLAVESSDNLYDAMMKLMINANLTDHEVDPDEQIDFYGVPMFISYANKAIYDAGGEEYVNCRDLECELPKEAAKEILMQRANNKANSDEEYDD